MMDTATMDSWIAYRQPNSAAPFRLFCFPYAGGSAAIFRAWPEALLAVAEVCPVQLPGREGRLIEPPFTRLTPLVQTLAYVLHPYLDRPFALFGHSMGALIAFELACELRRQGARGPAHLFVSARRAPQQPNADRPIHRLPEPAFIEKLRELKGTPEPILQNAELMQLLLPILRADFAVCETYSYIAEDPLDCPISVFGGLEDGSVSQAELAAWREHTQSTFTLRMLPGHHFFLQNTQTLLWRAISQDLARALTQITKDQHP